MSSKDELQMLVQILKGSIMHQIKNASPTIVTKVYEILFGEDAMSKRLNEIQYLLDIESVKENMKK